MKNAYIPASLIAFGLLIISSGCQKEVSLERISGTGSGTSDYQPTVQNSSWNYVSTGPDSGGMNLLSTAQDTLINFKDYHVFLSTGLGQTQEEYYHKIGNNYYMRGGLFGLNPESGYLSGLSQADISAMQNVEMLYLMDDQPAGTSWVGADLKLDMSSLYGAGTYFEDEYTFTIVEKGIQQTVNGVTFQDVIHEQLSLEYTIVNNGQILVAYSITGDYYFGRGVGILAFDYSASSLGSGADLYLDKYSIK